MSKQYDKEFEENAVTYYKEHDELNIKKCSENLGIAPSTLGHWIKKQKLTMAKFQLEVLVTLQVMKLKKMLD